MYNCHCATPYGLCFSVVRTQCFGNWLFCVSLGVGSWWWTYISCTLDRTAFWFQTFAVFWMFYAFFWVIYWRLNFICRRFGTLCLFHLHRPMKMEQTECSKTSAYKIQTPGTYPEESIQQLHFGHPKRLVLINLKLHMQRLLSSLV